MRLNPNIHSKKFSNTKVFLTYFLAGYHFMFATLAYAGNEKLGDDKEKQSKGTTAITINTSPVAQKENLSSETVKSAPPPSFFSIFQNVANGTYSFLKEKSENFRAKSRNIFPTAYAQEQPPAPLGEKELQECKASMETRQKELEKILATDQMDHTTILLGTTGAGKTTVFKYALKETLTAYIDKKGQMCVNDPNDPDAIGHQYTSQTSIPRVKNYWVDCPGLFDTNGPLQELLNAHSLPQVVEKSKKLRFLLAVSEEQLSTGAGRADGFLELTENLSKTLEGNPIDKLKKGLNIVVTQTTYMNDVPKFQNAITDLIKDRARELHPFQKQLLQWMADPNNKQITTLERPKLEGDIPIEGRKKLITDNAGYIDNIKVNIAYSTEAEDYVQHIAKGVTKEVTKCLEDFNKGFRQNTKEFIRSSDGDAQAVRDRIKRTITPLKNVLATEDTFNSDSGSIETALKTFDPKLKKEFSRLKKQRAFLLKLKAKGSKVSLALDKQNVLTHVTETADKLAKTPTPQIGATTLTLNGEIIGTSDIIKASLGRDNISMLDVYATHSLLVDDNLDKSGMSLALSGPQWVVRGEKTISLKGKNGQEIQPSHARKAENGLPGMPAQSGGNFYGIADDVFNGSKLTIDVSGGNGGPGQAGGNGIDGDDGIAGSLDAVEKETAIAKQEGAVDRLWWGMGWALWPFTTNTLERISYESGALAKNGGDSGAGGKGGSAGKAGSVIFEKFERGTYYRLETGIHKKDKVGQDGLDGLPGEEGKGGIHKDVFAGVRLKKTSTQAYLPKAVVDGVSGAVGGFCLGGIPGAVAGGVIGVLVPAAGTEMVDNNMWLWEKCPYKIKRSDRAADGKKPTISNSKDIQPAIESVKIDLQAIRDNWKARFTEL